VWNKESIKEDLPGPALPKKGADILSGRSLFRLLRGSLVCEPIYRAEGADAGLEDKGCFRCGRCWRCIIGGQSDMIGLLRCRMTSFHLVQNLSSFTIYQSINKLWHAHVGQSIFEILSPTNACSFTTLLRCSKHVL